MLFLETTVFLLGTGLDSQHVADLVCMLHVVVQRRWVFLHTQRFKSMGNVRTVEEKTMYLMTNKREHVADEEHKEPQTIRSKRKRKPRKDSVTFEKSFLLFSQLYNKLGQSELEPQEASRFFWESQRDVIPSQRRLHFRNMDDADVDFLRLTGTYNQCRIGNVRNKSSNEKSASNHARWMRISPEKRQMNWMECAALHALMKELNDVAEQNHLAPLRFKPVPDGLYQTDVLMQRADTLTPHLWSALQFKSCTFKSTGQMKFGGTSGYNVPLICLAMDFEKLQIMEHLLFTQPLEVDGASIHHGKISGNPQVQAAKTTTIALYEFLANIPSVQQFEREHWLFAPKQAAPTLARGLEVQRFCEKILGEEVESPWQQNQAVDAYILLDDVKLGLSFKTATKRTKTYCSFVVGFAPNKEELHVVIVGFRDENCIVSLGVMKATSVDWTRKTYSWSNLKPFKGILGITNGEQLRCVLRQVMQ